jgi:hypothetical protein
MYSGKIAVPPGGGGLIFNIDLSKSINLSWSKQTPQILSTDSSHLLLPGDRFCMSIAAARNVQAEATDNVDVT